MLAVLTIFTPFFKCRQRHYAVSQKRRFNSHDSAKKLFWTIIKEFDKIKHSESQGVTNGPSVLQTKYLIQGKLPF